MPRVHLKPRTDCSSTIQGRKIPKKNKNICTHEDLYSNVYSIFFFFWSFEDEITQCPPRGE